MKSFIDRNHPIFRRLWVRVATVAVPCLWAAFEFRTGATMWGLLFAGLGVFAAWELFLRGADK